MPIETSAVLRRSAMLRSAVSNGSRVLDGVDGRTKEARRFRDLIESFARDLGGLGQMTEGERALLRQAASLTIKVEKMQAAIVRGEEVDPDVLIRVNSEARRSLERIPKRPPPKSSLSDYIAGRGEAA